MQSACTAVLGLKRSPRIARIRCPARYTWSSSCESSAGISPAVGRASSPAFLSDYNLGGLTVKTLPALILCFALSSFAATGKSVSYKSANETLQAMLYAPDGKGPFPGISVIHEFWGLNRSEEH